RIATDMEVRSAQGRMDWLENFRKSEPMFCPFHDDQRASAFVIENKQGQKGLHCSACVQSFWATGYNDHYDFYSFVKAAKATSKIGALSDPLLKFYEDGTQGVSPENTVFLDREHLGPLPLKKGATVIKSPKGSGKTEFLTSLVAGSKGRILLVGHRRTLIRS